MEKPRVVLTPDEARAQRRDQESRGQAEAARRSRNTRVVVGVIVLFLIVAIVLVVFRVI